MRLLKSTNSSSRKRKLEALNTSWLSQQPIEKAAKVRDDFRRGNLPRLSRQPHFNFPWWEFEGYVRLLAEASPKFADLSCEFRSCLDMVLQVLQNVAMAEYDRIHAGDRCELHKCMYYLIDMKSRTYIRMIASTLDELLRVNGPLEAVKERLDKEAELETGRLSPNTD